MFPGCCSIWQQTGDPFTGVFHTDFPFYVNDSALLDSSEAPLSQQLCWHSGVVCCLVKSLGGPGHRVSSLNTNPTGATLSRRPTTSEAIWHWDRGQRLLSGPTIQGADEIPGMPLGFNRYEADRTNGTVHEPLHVAAAVWPASWCLLALIITARRE
jgi:hypothetical protein